MKVLSVSLILGALALVQGSFSDQRSLATLSNPEDNPYLLHLRIANLDKGGHLVTAGAALLDHQWAITTAHNAEELRFAWVRYGAENIVHPELVTEFATARFHIHPEYDGTHHDIAIIDLNRYVEYTDTIQPIRIGAVNTDSTYKFCGWGLAPGQTELPIHARCFDLAFQRGSLCGLGINDDYRFCTASTQFDIDSTGESDNGSPLVQFNENNEALLIGLLAQPPANPGNDIHAGLFVRVEMYIDWINEVTGLDLAVVS